MNIEEKQSAKGVKHIVRYRPPGWQALVMDLIRISREAAETSGINTRDQQDLMVGEAFADAMLEGLRNLNGCPAMVAKNRVHIMVRGKNKVLHPVGTQLTFTGDLAFSGSGRLSFIPDDPQPAQIDTIRRED